MLYGVSSVFCIGRAACPGIKGIHMDTKCQQYLQGCSDLFISKIFEVIAVTCCHFKLCVSDATCTISVQKINRKLGRAKVAYQEGYMEVRRILRKARGHATQTCSLV